MGRAADFLPYFVHTFQRMGELGIGRGRGTFAISSVSVLDAEDQPLETIYEEGELRLPEKHLGLDDALRRSWSLDPVSLRLRWVTPLRLLKDGELCRGPRFLLIVQNLLRRLENLVAFHCGHSGELSYGELLEQAETVRLSRDSTRWYDWERYSKRQDRRMKLGGLMGEAVYEGNIEPFLPLLTLGEWVNVGKGTTFGLGRFRIERIGGGFPELSEDRGGYDDLLVG